jgi:hypothetical protein
MQIKENTKYRQRDGKIVGPLHPRGFQANYPWIDENGSTYTDSGRIYIYREHPQDLIEEIKTVQIKGQTKYRTRGGDIVGPLTLTNLQPYPWAFDGEAYTHDGRVLIAMEHDKDLVAEVNETPWNRYNEGIIFSDQAFEVIRRDGRVDHYDSKPSSLLWGDVLGWRLVAKPEPVAAAPLTLEERVLRLEQQASLEWLD